MIPTTELHLEILIRNKMTGKTMLAPKIHSFGNTPPIIDYVAMLKTERRLANNGLRWKKKQHRHISFVKKLQGIGQYSTIMQLNNPTSPVHAHLQMPAIEMLI
jgi:hypothetical protein